MRQIPCCLLFVAASAIAGAAPGPDAFGYTVAPTSQFSFLQITNGSQRVLWFDDDAPFTANIGFTFNFYGSNYTTVAFNPNGLMTFGGAGSDFLNVNLTTTSPSNNFPCVAVLWDDWETQEPWSDGVYYNTTGAAGSRQFIVQWNKVVPVSGDGTNTVTFEARLFEGTDRILLSYFDTVVSDETTLPPDAASLGVGATVGIRDIGGQSNNRNLQWSFNQAVITNGLNLIFTPPNHPPVASNDLVFTLEDTPVTLNVLANDRDAEGDSLVIVANTLATNGVIAVNADGTGVYSPDTNFSGADHFSYIISDGRGGSAIGQVSITVAPVNDLPTLDALNDVTLQEDAGMQLLNLRGIGSGAANENDTLTVTASSSNPLLIPTPTVTYTSPNANGILRFSPATNAFGTAIITVTVNDNQPSNNIVTRSFTVTVNPVNDPPFLSVIPDQTNDEDKVIGPLAFTVGDPETPASSLVVSASSTNTTLLPTNNIVFGGSGSNRTVTLMPATNQFGATLIMVTVDDGTGGAASIAFRVTINPVNDAPVAQNQSVATPEDTPTNLLLSGTDVDSPNLTFALRTAPTNGVLSLLDTNTGAVIYTPNTNYVGSDFFDFTVSDGSLVATGQVSITVTPVNDPLVAQSQSVTTPEDTATNLMLTATDADSTNLTFALRSAPTNGVLSFFDTTTGTVTYTPNTNYNGSDFFDFTVSDGSLLATGQVSITVTPVNDPPVAGADALDTCVNQALVVPSAAVLANDQDVDAGDILSVTNVSASSSAGGSVTLTDGNITFTPSNNFSGLDNFTYTLSDGQGGEATGTVSVRVWPLLTIISIVRQSGGSVVMRVCGLSGTNYVMEATSDFSSWSNLGIIPEINSGLFQFEDAGAAGLNARFYRVFAP